MKKERRCEDCYWNSQCGRDYICPHFDELNDEDAFLLMSEELQEKWINDWNTYLAYINSGEEQ
ncbi:MAG: hypothetical protein GX963_08750 [Bacteroidales bacterium]|nr:hypothetical protein [Bacteroidales bacterium]